MISNEMKCNIFSLVNSHLDYQSLSNKNEKLAYIFLGSNSKHDKKDYEEIITDSDINNSIVYKLNDKDMISRILNEITSEYNDVHIVSGILIKDGFLSYSVKSVFTGDTYHVEGVLL